jgi:hypothetical protein
MENKQIIAFFDNLHSVIKNKSLVKMVLSNQRNQASDLKSIIITLIEIKKGIRLNFVYRHKTMDITKNFDVETGVTLAVKAMEDDFFNADLFTTTKSVRLLVNVNGKVKIRANVPALKPVASFVHDHVKERVISTHNNIYLRELGVLNSAFEVRNEMNDKYLQINRYIELVEPFIKELALPEQFQVADMGSGKGYLTFALYDYLTNILGKKPAVTGVESRKELVTLSNEIAEKACLSNLKFVCSTIGKATLEKIDILIALHACDTATDDAIFRGVSSGASLIVCAPCCHKQVRKEFKVTNELKSITKHGILEERQAEIVTDAIRALLLEAHGYKTKVFEFISTEHTHKNVMIVGRKVAGKPADMKKSLNQIVAIKELFGIKQHYLEVLFGN